MLMGTAAYMSPEQARGHPVDKRTDIWAFGCVLYEMLAGRPAFGRDTLSDTIAAVLDREPAWDALPADMPAGVHRVLRRCLEKDAKRRFRDIADARLDLDEALAAPPKAPRETNRPTRRVRERLPWVIAAAAIVVAAGLGLQSWRLAQRAAPAPTSGRAVDRFIELLPPDTLLAGAPALAMSPDGRRVAYVAVRSGIRRLYVRDFAEPSARPLAGTDGADQPFFSPDGRWIGFFA